MADTREGIDERRIDELIRDIRRIDRMLENATRTLIDFIERALKDPAEMPLFVSLETQPIEKRMYRITHAITCSTLLRLNVLRRRFPFLGKGPTAEHLTKSVRQIPDRFLSPPMKFENDDAVFEFISERLSSSTFGALNPLTASWIFWSLMYAGESFAHSGLGFLSFFAMFWAIERGRPSSGAGLDPWRPTAYITSRCLFPIEMMIGTCGRRAERLETIRKMIGELEKLAKATTEHERWTFALKLDLLGGILRETALIAIVPEEFLRCADSLAKLAGDLECNDSVASCWSAAKKAIAGMLKAVGSSNAPVIASASDVVESLLPRLIDILADKQRREALLLYCHQFRKDASEGEWQEKRQAAQRAHNLCRSAFEAYRGAMEACRGIRRSASARSLQSAIAVVAKANRDVKALFEKEIGPSLAWCKQIVNEESARASAGNDSDFDATELVHAMAICVRAKKMTRSEVKDTVVKALQGRQRDGSWAPGKPFYIRNRVLGAWSTTSETIWTLASALVSHPEITEADDALLAFVRWLETTQQAIREPGRDAMTIGWSSERFRQPLTVDTWATCNAVNALLPIRTLLEYRLWQICEQNFTVIEELRDISEIDPADLRLKHRQRLHRQLIEAGWRTERADKQAKYAFILHGPPGTSKTTLAGALARQLWRTTQFAKRPEPAGSVGARVVRITPADFMHGGEENIDARARVIFKLLSHIRAATIFFDEIDDFLRRRFFTGEPTFIKLVAPAMLNRLQDLRDAAPMQEICFVLGTNFIDKMDPALIRPGRIDQAMPVVFPDLASKKAIAQRLRVPHALINAVSDRTFFWPYQTFAALCETLKLEKHAKLVPDGLDAVLAEFRAEVDRAERFYQDPERWQTADDRFQSEFLRIVFSHGEEEAYGFSKKLATTDVASGFPLAAVSLIEKNGASPPKAAE